MTTTEPTVILRLVMHPEGDLQIEARHAAGQQIEHACKNWGIVLADILRHLSFCYKQTDGCDIETTRERLLHYMNESLAEPDPDHKLGKMLGRKDPPGG